MTAEGAVALIAAEVLPEAWQKALARPMTLTGVDLVDARCEAEMRREALVLERQGSWPSAPWLPCCRWARYSMTFRMACCASRAATRYARIMSAIKDGSVMRAIGVPTPSTCDVKWSALVNCRTVQSTRDLDKDEKQHSLH